MNRRRLIIAAMALSLVPLQQAQADSVDDLVEVLRDQGFRQIEVERTLLGRVRILASSNRGTRELVINARTGEVLRDVWIDRRGRIMPSELAGDASGNRSQGGSDDDGNDDDDDADDEEDDGDDDDDDDSGSSGSGGNSGSGGGDDDDDD